MNNRFSLITVSVVLALLAACSQEYDISVDSSDVDGAHTVTTSLVAGNGRVLPQEVSGEHDSVVEIAFYPDDGFAVGDISGCDGQLIDNRFITAPLSDNCILEVAFEPQLSQPENFRSEAEGEFIKLRWDEVSGAEGYRLHCSAEPDPRHSGEENPCADGWTDELIYPYRYVARPGRGQSYYFSVSAYRGDLTGPESQQIILSEPPGTGEDEREKSCDLYFSSDGEGSGYSIGDSANISTINNAMAEMTGGTLCLLSGVYQSGLTLTQSGSREYPFTITGVNGYPMFKGNFDSLSRSKTGEHAITIRASNLNIENILFRNVGVCFRIDSDVKNIRLRNFRAADVATCVDVARYRDHSVKNLVIDGAMILRFTRNAILLGAYSDGVSVINSYIDMQPEKMGGRGVDYVAGIGLYDEAQNILIENTSVLNVIGKSEGYSQGDGILAEVGVQSVRVTDSYLRGHQDGCIDTKAADFVIDGTIAAECKRSYRFWQNHYPNGAKCQRCISYDPTGDAHFSLHHNSNISEEVVIYSKNDAALVYSSDGGVFSVKRMFGVYPFDPMGAFFTVEDARLVLQDDYAIPPVPNPTKFQL